MRRSVWWILLLSLSFGGVSQAALRQPDCAALEQWAMGMDPRQKWQVAPSSRLIAALQDEQLIPLFGLSILEWQQEDFRTADQTLITCHKQATSRKDKVTASALVKARQAIRGSGALVQRAQVAYQSSGESIQSLLALPEDPDYLASVTQAIEVLQHGRADARALMTLDPVSRNEITRLSKVYRTLPSQYAGQWVAQLEQRRDRLQQLQQAAQQQAQEELAAVEANIAALPLTQEGLDTLAELENLPAQSLAPEAATRHYQHAIAAKRTEIEAYQRQQQQAAQLAADRQRLRELQTQLETLAGGNEGITQLNAMAADLSLQRLPRSETQPFLNELARKRLEIREALAAERQQAARQRADNALQETASLTVNEPADLGTLFQQGSQTFEQLRRQDRNAAGLYFQAFQQRFANEAEAMLPAFREQLQRYPASEQGLAQLETAVTDLTGVTAAGDVMQPYYDAAKQHAISLRETIRLNACEQIWQQVGVSKKEAIQPLWSATGKTTLGEFLCQLSEQGHEIHEYDAPGLFSDTHTIKLTVKSEGLKQIHLHQGEVTPDEEMLLGYEVSDANQTVSLSVKEWQAYAEKLLDSAKAECDRLADKPRSELSLNEQMTLMQCLLQSVPEMKIK